MTVASMMISGAVSGIAVFIALALLDEDGSVSGSIRSHVGSLSGDNGTWGSSSEGASSGAKVDGPSWVSPLTSGGSGSGAADETDGEFERVVGCVWATLEGFVRGEADGGGQETWAEAAAVGAECFAGALDNGVSAAGSKGCVPAGAVDAAVMFGAVSLAVGSKASEYRAATERIETLRSVLASRAGCVAGAAVFDPVYVVRNSIGRLDAMRGYLAEYASPRNVQRSKELFAAAERMATSPAACFMCYDSFHARPIGYTGPGLENPFPFSAYRTPMAKILVHRLGMDILLRKDPEAADRLRKLMAQVLPGPAAGPVAAPGQPESVVIAEPKSVTWSGNVLADPGFAEDAAAQLHANGAAYVHLADVFSAYERAVLVAYYNVGVHHYYVVREDSEQGRRTAKSDRLGWLMNVALCPLAEAALSRPVKPAYPFYSDYVRGDRSLHAQTHVLHPHTDREDNKYSFSVQLELVRHGDANGTPYWPLYVDTAETLPPRASWRDLPPDDQLRAIYLRDGDGLMFQGRKHVHLRKTLPPHLDRVTNLILHYVDSDFDLRFYKIRQEIDPSL